MTSVTLGGVFTLDGKKLLVEKYSSRFSSIFIFSSHSAEVDTTEMTDETETDEDDLDHDRAIDDEEPQAIRRRETVPKLRRENPAAIPALDPDPAAPVRTNYTPADTFVQNVATLTSLEISLPRGL